MTYKTILSVIGVNSFEDDLQAAANICAANEAHLTALMVKLAAPPPLGDYAATMSVAWLDERERDLSDLRKGVQGAKAVLSRTGVSFQVDSIYSEFAWADNEIGERARYADLTLIGTGLAADPELRARTVNGALFNSARPVLLVPKGRRATMVPKTVLLAWNSHIEAARAVGGALELMGAADLVHVTMVDPEDSPAKSGEEPGADIAAYLARHGVKVTVDRLPSSGHRVEDVINRHALSIGADLIVMGAYGHSRMRERIFGGVTRSMIDTAAAPVFMVH
ncbi:universal stress protein [Ensifer sp. LCM 4579]|uniref:universal stress protein n=1 Tax=Ensifer sp. LCM 4579 TaxID=1848292 RepID=UPI0008D9E8A6|nr:universal stress protein [Ensifer sp. LCM 4579]OHV79845.1 universal stress protein [Ensifer sp. LCM 4579]